MESGNTYNAKYGNEALEGFSDEWESLSDTTEDAYYAVNALKKSRRRERRRATRKHSKPVVRYKDEKAQHELAHTHKVDTKKDEQDKEHQTQVIESELKNWGLYEADELDELGRTFNYSSNPHETYNPNIEAKEIIRSHYELFRYLGESTSYDPEIESKFGAIADKKERLRFIGETSLANKVRLLCGDDFDDLNSDSFNDHLDFQQDLMQGVAVVEDWWGDKYTPDPESIPRKDIRLGITRGAMRSAMLGTPEYGAYKTALSIAKNKHKNVPFFFPKIKGLESGVGYWDRFCEEDEYEEEKYEEVLSIGDWSVIIDEYENISRQVAKNSSDLDDDSLEHRAVMEAANIYVKAMDFGEGCSFSTAVACSRLGEKARKRLVDISNYENISENVSRFIGKSGDSWRERGLELGMKRVSKELEELESASDEEKNRILASRNESDIKKITNWRDQELERIIHKYDKEINRTRDAERRELYENRKESEKNRILEQYNERANHLESRDLDGLISDLHGELADIEDRYEKSKSLAEKAIDLNAMSRKKWLTPYRSVFAHQDDSLVIPTAFGKIDWINDVPLGAIKKAHQRMRSGMSMAEIELLTKEDYIRRINPDLSQTEVNRILFGTHSNLTLMDMSNFIKALEDKSLPKDYNHNDYYSSALGWRYLVDGNYEKAREDYFRKRPKSHEFEWLREEEGINSLLTYELLKKNPELTAHELVSEMKKYQGNDWLLSSLYDQEVDVLSFPFDAYDKTRAVWCAKNGFYKLGPEYGKETIGKVILTRLNAGVERSLHDATMWLKYFDIPETTHDIKRIKQDLADGAEIESLDDYTIKLKDESLERELLTQIFFANKEDRKKLRLSNKPQKIARLFSSPANAFVYQELLDYIKDDSVQRDFVEETASEASSYYDEYLSDEGKIRKDDFISDVEWALSQMDYDLVTNDIEEEFDLTPGKKSPREISLMVQELGNLGERRKKYANEATAWITNYKMAPHDSLTSAWKDRASALKLGADDTLKSINDTMTRRAFLESVRDSYEFRTSGLTEEDLTGRYEPFVEELTRQRGKNRTYSTDTIITGINYYDKMHNPKKICPAAEYKLEHKLGSYVGTVLAHNDPRGMTIGLDTGCCMTVEGYSYSCIQSGYRDENAGFFALYESDGQIVAQSYFYFNPDEPEVLVMDNIEANQGRDANTIVDLYGDFFRKYLKERFKEDSEWQIREVHVGTQYGELVKPIVNRLLEASIVLNPDRSVYTDAENDQRLLFRLTDEEINEARQANSEPIDNRTKLMPTHKAIISNSPLTDSQAEIIKDLEARLYPAEMRQYEDEDFLNSELSMPGVENYSFIMDTQTDATKESIGYCIAYEADSETDSDSDKKCIYVADFGILSDYRLGVRTALNGLDELLSRVKEGGYDKIEMEARESTSYRLLTSPVGQRVLDARGFRLSDYGESESFGGVEKTHLISLETA